MTWYNPKTWFGDREKLNPAQASIRDEEGTEIASTTPASYLTAFNTYESVNRGVNMIVNACSSLDYDVKNKVSEGKIIGARQKAIYQLLNVKPNPFQSIQEFRAQIFLDFLLEGNAFVYYDGNYFFHLPAANVTIIPDEKTYISRYEYTNGEKFLPEEIIHIKDLSSNTIYRGASRLSAADRNIKILQKMLDFQDKFFENGAIVSFAVATDNTLSESAKDRTINRWVQKYNIKGGSRKPFILDSGLKPVKLSETSFKEMDFDVSVKTINVKILETLGVPPVLLDGGNQANISPNLRLFYLETILPIVRKFVSGVESMFGYDIEAVVSNVSALQPELSDVASYYTSLVNGGLMYPNEAREVLRLPKDSDENSNKLRIPANIAGSAVDPSQGGAPKKPTP